jgi:hypothetical protein
MLVALPQLQRAVLGVVQARQTCVPPASARDGGWKTWPAPPHRTKIVPFSGLGKQPLSDAVGPLRNRGAPPSTDE